MKIIREKSKRIYSIFYYFLARKDTYMPSSFVTVASSRHSGLLELWSRDAALSSAGFGGRCRQAEILFANSHWVFGH